MQAGSNYYLNPVAGGTGPLLKYGGTTFVAGQFGTWLPIGAEAVGSGYDVAWKDSVSGLYTVWSADSNGNFVSNIVAAVSGTDAALESLETTFHQDLNGDGTIGAAAIVGTMIETLGSTSLMQAGSNYYLNPVAGGTGPLLKYGGTTFVAGQFGTWLPIGAEAVGSGYDVAWKDSVSGLYTVWSADSNGNFVSNIVAAVSGTNAALESLETTFQQDLNADGVIGVAPASPQASGAVNPNSFLFGNAGHDGFVFSEQVLESQPPPVQSLLDQLHDFGADSARLQAVLLATALDAEHQTDLALIHHFIDHYLIS
jgi:20S proteasome alpha/beta subunit